MMIPYKIEINVIIHIYIYLYQHIEPKCVTQWMGQHGTTCFKAGVTTFAEWPRKWSPAASTFDVRLLMTRQPC